MKMILNLVQEKRMIVMDIGLICNKTGFSGRIFSNPLMHKTGDV
jgi:hypothetical protein